MEYNADIYDAVELGDLDSVKLYWTENININYQDLNGMTLLMYASSYGFEDIVEFLLSFNPDIELQNKEQKTALDMANKNGHKTVFNRLEKMKK